MGVDDLQNNTVNLMDGTRDVGTDAGTKSNFTANLSDTDRAAFNAATPNRFAVKHAHSQQNPERDWGKNALHAIEFAYYVLNQKFGTAPADAGPNVERGRRYHAGQILTIAASVSNGAGSSLAAVEQDSQHWRSEEHTSELQSPCNLVCRLLLEKKKKKRKKKRICRQIVQIIRNRKR